MVSHMQGFIGCWFLVVALLNLKATADSYTVGEDLGWTIPPAGSTAYSTWASTKSFQLGDTIEFKWSGPHTVAEVSQADYDSCSKSNPLFFYDSSPAKVTLTSNLTRYFICTEDSHCSNLGQKVTIRIGGDNTNVDRWWNSASSLTMNFAALLFCSTIVIFFLSF